VRLRTTAQATRPEHDSGSLGPRTPAVELDNLEKHYGQYVALRSISLTVVEGEFFSLIGPSGCGKTTTLRLIAGLDPPTAGRIIVRGKDLTTVPAHKRPVNSVFQTYALFPHLSVAQNVGFGLKERRLPRRDIVKKVSRILELVQLDARASSKPSQLSGGQQQRVALARALVLEPDVLLLDEPLGALDLQLRKEMQGLLRAVHDETKTSFLYVTHDQEEAFAMSDRVGVMSNGDLQQVSTPEEIYSRPSTEFVADFVGASNRIEGIVTHANPGGRYEVSAEDASLAIRGCGPKDIVVGTRVIAVIRPEGMKVTGESSPSPDTHNVAHAYVRSIHYLGPITRYEFATEPAVLLIVDTQGRRDRLQIDNATWLHWDEDDVWIIPARSEKQQSS
jgi:spermidine/putrescine transport system ATP-binding protein